MNDNFDLVVFEGVYPPSEDSYLLLDSVRFRSDDIVLDVGCGAGLMTLAAATRVKRVLSIDISLEAVKNTKENLKQNNLGHNVSLIQSNLLSPFSQNTKFSLIFFNPPYLPEDEDSTDIDHAFVGGVRGIELTERFISEATQHLIKGGRIYVVVSSLSDIDGVISTLEENDFDIFHEKETSMFFEKIQVLRGVWQGHKETVL